MGDDQQSLSGKWIGRYSYDSGGQACSFEAWLAENTGALSGETVEPNEFAHEAADTLMAAINGSRVGLSVTFTKTYTDVDVEPVAYTGTIDPTFSRVSGTWYIIGSEWCRGSFTLSRAASVEQATTMEMEAV